MMYVGPCLLYDVNFKAWYKTQTQNKEFQKTMQYLKRLIITENTFKDHQQDYAVF